nr:ribonuclease H [Ipomoea batatas]
MQPHEGGVVGSSLVAVPANQQVNQSIQRKDEVSASYSSNKSDNKIKASERSPEVHDNLERSTKKTKRLYNPPEVETMQGVETTPAEETNSEGGGDAIMGESVEASANQKGSNGKKNMDTLGGSRFEALQENDQEEVNCVEEENIMHEPESSPNNTRGNMQPISSKGKRPSVQVNEKQILNEKAEKYSGQTSNAANTSRGEKSSYSKRGYGGNKAGAAERHIVVRGEKFGKVSVATVVENEFETQRQEGFNEMVLLEHHEDPPKSNEDVSEVVIEEKDSACDGGGTMEDGWYVLNTDGSFDSGANNGSCAGVVRDSRGNWCGGFGFRIPATSVALTEAWAILKGVEWAWRKGFRKLIVQSDSKRVIDWIDGMREREHLSDWVLRVTFFFQAFSVYPDNRYKGNQSQSEWISKVMKNLSKERLCSQTSSAIRSLNHLARDPSCGLGRFLSPINKVPGAVYRIFSLINCLGVARTPKDVVNRDIGPDASGKTTLALHIIRRGHKNKEVIAALVDAEHALRSQHWLQLLG